MSPRVRLRTWSEGVHGQFVTTDIDTLATALYVKVDDALKASPELAPWRPPVGIAPTLSDAELVTLAVMSALLGYTSERRWLRRAGGDFRHLFPCLPQQSGYNKRLRAACSLVTHMIRMLAQDTSLCSDDVWVVDSTPVGCGCSRETAKRSDLAGWAQYGYCASHSRYFWGVRRPLVCGQARTDRLRSLTAPTPLGLNHLGGTDDIFTGSLQQSVPAAPKAIFQRRVK